MIIILILIIAIISLCMVDNSESFWVIFFGIIVIIIKIVAPLVILAWLISLFI